MRYSCGACHCSCRAELLRNPRSPRDPHCWQRAQLSLSLAHPWRQRSCCLWRQRSCCQRRMGYGCAGSVVCGFQRLLHVAGLIASMARICACVWGRWPSPLPLRAPWRAIRAVAAASVLGAGLRARRARAACVQGCEMGGHHPTPLWPLNDAQGLTRLRCAHLQGISPGPTVKQIGSFGYNRCNISGRCCHGHASGRMLSYKVWQAWWRRNSTTAHGTLQAVRDRSH